MRPRLVGAFIIIVVATIVLPLLFQNPVKYPDTPDFAIPPEPAMPALKSIDAEKYSALKQRALELSSNASIVKSSDETVPALNSNETELDKAESKTTKKTFQLDNHGLPLVWSVQLATFKEYDNAATLREKLRSAGFSVYTRRITNSKGNWVQVLVGPIRNRPEVEKLKLKLSKQFNLDGVVTRYMR